MNFFFIFSKHWKHLTNKLSDSDKLADSVQKLSSWFLKQSFECDQTGYLFKKLTHLHFPKTTKSVLTSEDHFTSNSANHSYVHCYLYLLVSLLVSLTFDKSQ